MADDAPHLFTLATLPKPEGGEKLYAVIGDPVKHSLSPQMHNAAFRALGLNSRYVKIHLTPEELVEGVGKMKTYGYSGWNVTVPHKTAMFEMVDTPTTEARRVRAVNTVFKRNDRWFGSSTDGYGWRRAIQETFFIKPEEVRLLIVGAGGSAQSLVLYAASLNARYMTLTNRTVDKAHYIREMERAARYNDLKQPATSFNWENWIQAGKALWGFFRTPIVAVTPQEKAAALSEAVLIVNTTSSGLKLDDEIPIELPDDLSGKYVYDLIYNPAETAFLRAAKTAGAKTANGLSMLLWQGVRAFEIWHPELDARQRFSMQEKMRQALEEVTGQKL